MSNMSNLSNMTNLHFAPHFAPHFATFRTYFALAPFPKHSSNVYQTSPNISQHFPYIPQTFRKHYAIISTCIHTYNYNYNYNYTYIQLQLYNYTTIHCATFPTHFPHISQNIPSRHVTSSISTFYQHMRTNCVMFARCLRDVSQQYINNLSTCLSTHLSTLPKYLRNVINNLSTRLSTRLSTFSEIFAKCYQQSVNIY